MEHLIQGRRTEKAKAGGMIVAECLLCIRAIAIGLGGKRV